MNELINEMIKEFEESKGGSTSFVFDDGDEYRTDTGYAMEGINAFAERLNKRLISMTNGEVIMTLFPNAKVDERTHTVYIIGDNVVGVSPNWWNAQYKTENERVNCENTKCDRCVNHNNCDYEPLNTAIKAVDAWDKVLNEIDIRKCGDWIATETVRDIINKHLGEVEE